MIKVIHSWPRVCGLPALTIKEDPLYCQAPYPFSYSISHPTPTYPCPPIDKKKIYFHCSFCFLISLTEWMIVTHLMFFTWNYRSAHVEPWYLITRKTLHVVYNKVSNLLRSDTEWGILLILWFDITHTQTITYNAQKSQ